VDSAGIQVLLVLVGSVVIQELAGGVVFLDSVVTQVPVASVDSVVTQVPVASVDSAGIQVLLVLVGSVVTQARADTRA